MKITTKYYAFIREKIGRNAEEFELDEGSTVADFIKLLAGKYGENLGGVFEGTRLMRGYAIALNGESIEPSVWSSTRLKDGDVVVILPPIAGG